MICKAPAPLTEIGYYTTPSNGPYCSEECMEVAQREGN